MDKNGISDFNFNCFSFLDNLFSSLPNPVRSLLSSLVFKLFRCSWSIPLLLKKLFRFLSWYSSSSSKFRNISIFRSLNESTSTAFLTAESTCRNSVRNFPTQPSHQNQNYVKRSGIYYVNCQTNIYREYM